MTAPTHSPPRRKGRPRKRLTKRGAEYRSIFVTGGSLAVTLPAGCVDMLRVREGGMVQVVPHVSGKVIIARVGLRVGVDREIAKTAAEVVVLRRQLLKAKKRLLSLPVRQVSRGMSAGFSKAYGAWQMDVDTRLDTLAGLVANLCAILAPSRPLSPGEGEAREQIDAAAARLGAGIGFALPAGVVAVTVPDPD